MAVTANQFRPPAGTPDGSATPRSASDPSNPYNTVSNTPQGLLQWMTWEKQHNPSYQVASGFHQDASGNVVEDQPGFLLSHPWVIPTIGIAAGAGIAAATGAAASTLGPSTAANIAGTTAATATPAGIAAPVAASSLGGALSSPSFLSSIIGPAIGGIGNIIGANIQSNANTEGAQIQAKSVADALAFEKQAYGTTLTNLAPYITSGATATDKMAQLLGLPARYNATTTATGPPPTGQPIPGAPTFTPTPGSNPGQQTSIAGVAPPLAAGTPVPNQYRLGGSTPTAAGGGPPPVTLRAPDGSVKQVPPGDVPHYLAQGATLVGAAA